MSPGLGEIGRGQWRIILPALGVPPKFLSDKHGPCPLCGGKDRFRFDDKNGRGTYYCNGCGSGDGWDLLQKATRRPLKELRAEVVRLAGGGVQRNWRPRETEAEDLTRRAKAIWDAARPLAYDGGPACRYLMHRVGFIPVDAGVDLRQGVVWHRDVRKELPALLARFTSPAGEFSNVHVTYLTKDGRKAPVKPDKRVLAGQLAPGGAVRLGGARRGPIGIAEGIETALSATRLFGLPTWAALNAVMLGKWQPPEGVEEVVIFGDNDQNHAGQAAAYALSSRFLLAGAKASVRLPEEIGWDWNDVLQKTPGR